MAYGHFERKIEVQHLIGTIDRSDVCVCRLYVCMRFCLRSNTETNHETESKNERDRGEQRKKS